MNEQTKCQGHTAGGSWPSSSSVAVAAATVVVPTSAMSWVDRTLQCTYMRVGSSSTKLGEPPGRRKWSCRATTSSHASLERLRKDSIVCLRDSAWMGFEMYPSMPPSRHFSR